MINLVSFRSYLLAFLALWFISLLSHAQTCSDGIMNQDETGVDCGGVCGGGPANSDICNAASIVLDGSLNAGQTNNCGAWLEYYDCDSVYQEKIGVFYKASSSNAHNTFQISFDTADFLNDSVTVTFLHGTNCNSAAIVASMDVSTLDTTYLNFPGDSIIYVFIGSNAGNTGDYSFRLEQAAIPGTGPDWSQDCQQAIHLCNNEYVYTEKVIGLGMQELDSNTTCIPGGEHNSTWFTFTVQQDGPLGFQLKSIQDYNFALFDITNKGCEEIPNLIPVRCNSFADPGCSGLDYLNSQPATPAIASSDTNYLAGINASAGETYALLVDDYYGNNLGYTLTFKGTSLIDTTGPQIECAYTDLSDSTYVIQMSEPVQCASINQPDFRLYSLSSGFDLTSAIDSVAGLGCKGLSGQSARYVKLYPNVFYVDTLLARLDTQGIVLADNCGNLATFSQDTFYVKSLCDSVVDLNLQTEVIDSVVCLGEVASVEASGSGDCSLEFSLDGQEFGHNHLFGNLSPGHYTLYGQSNGACRDSIAFQIDAPDSISYTLEGIDAYPDIMDGSIVVSGLAAGDSFSLDGISYFTNDSLTNVQGQITYPVYFKNSNGCMFVDSVWVDYIVGIQENINDPVRVFPNPTTGTVTLSNLQPDMNLQLTNNLGQRLFIPDLMITSGSHEQTLQLSRGIYFLTITAPEFRSVRKIVVI